MVLDIQKSISHLVKIIQEGIEPGNEIPDSNERKELLSLLERFISLELRRKYSEWKYESIDGIYVGKIYKIIEDQIALLGMSVLVSDQSVVPINVQIKISSSVNEVDWMECKLAERGKDGISKVSYNSNRWRKQLYTLDANLINWYYSVSYNRENSEG